MDWQTAIFIFIISIVYSGALLAVKSVWKVTPEAARKAILPHVEQLQKDATSIEIVRTTDRGPFPWLDVDVGGAVVRGSPVDVSPTLYYSVWAHNVSGDVLLYHAKLHTTFHKIRTVEVLPVAAQA